MLHELRVENLLLLEQAELRLGAGLNVLTGETGAGKTLLAQALDLLLGGKARPGLVRPGAEEAWVEGVFSRPGQLEPSREERIPEGADEIVLARRVWPDGRTRAYVCGRSANLTDLRQLGSRLLAFYGQHESRRLMLAAAQLEILDALGGASIAKLRHRAADAYTQARELATRLEGLEAASGAREREIDLLRFELGEIEAIDPSEDEACALEEERQRLRHVEMLRAAVLAGVEAIVPEQGPGAAELLAAPAAPLEAAAVIDPALAPLAGRLSTLCIEAEDVARELRGYLERVDEAPGRLQEVEERLEQFSRLQRKHGGTIADVLAHAATCRARCQELEGAEVALEAAQAELEAARSRLLAATAELTKLRRRAACRLSEQVRERLAELAMPDARFGVSIEPRSEGPGLSGGDAVEFQVAANAGLPMGPLRDVASGGEVSRVMLALLTVAHGKGGEQAEQPTLVFDEIDAGIGGRTARAVGEQLRSLAQGRQVLCITHLPQVAALAERHFTIVKEGSAIPARTAVRRLVGDELVAEVVRMLGAGEDDDAASQHARQLLRAA